MKTGIKIAIGIGVALTIGATIFLIARKRKKDAEAKLSADGTAHWSALGTRSQFKEGFKSGDSMLNASADSSHIIDVKSGVRKSDGATAWNNACGCAK